jgi:hypothetical protein
MEGKERKGGRGCGAQEELMSSKAVVRLPKLTDGVVAGALH